MSSAAKGWSRLAGAAAAVAAAAAFLPPLWLHLRRSASRFVFADDARQWVAPFLDTASSDFATGYFRDLTPAGYRLLYTAAGALLDVERFSKLLPYLLLLAVCALVALTTAHLAGRTAGLISACLVLAATPVLEQLAGATPRAFAFPVLAAAACGLARGKPRIVALATVAGAAFYPAAGLLAGTALAASSLVGSNEEGARSRAALVVLTLAVSCAVILPLHLSQRQYGRRVSAADLAAYPEAGPGGRYWPPDRPPFAPFRRAVLRSVSSALRSEGQPIVPTPVHERPHFRAGVIAVSALVLLARARTDRDVRRLLVLPLVALALYPLAVALHPRLFTPDRFLFFPATLLPAIAVPVAAMEAARRTRRTWPGVALALVLLLLLGGRGDPRAGMTVNARENALLFEHVAALPGPALLAGWPTGPVDSVPYLTGKPAFLTFETHAAFHTAAMDENRRRMNALVSAYFATSPGPLLRLRDDHVVTHLLIDTRHYAGEPPRYFVPFDESTRRAAAGLEGAGAETLRQVPLAGEFRHGTLVLLDLRRVAPRTGP